MADERERDVVLSPNEFVYVLDKTKGIISTLVGSTKMSLSNSDALVVFNEKTKRFEETSATEAITTFVSAPENWYVVLKNPARDNGHPRIGVANSLPELNIGKKVNIPGNVTFALYPGQMAKVIQGHRMHSNQYLLARVYDNSDLQEDLEIGTLLIIKGDETPFFIPPTGIEVIPMNNGEYVRDAVTLERLEYCILKNENGEKKYIHGPSVVFPDPDEKFVVNKEDGGYKFRAIELSDISGIYVKVISDYEENDVEYRTGEELFITGKDQMIYYPRPEHAIIDYDGKIMHHAIAIPSGEGRYVLNRKTGDVRMVKGPAMFLPDPRDEVIVKRKLTKKQCEMWYPGNKEVLDYNVQQPEPYIDTDGIHLNVNGLVTTDSLCCSNTVTTSSGFLGQGNVSIEKKSGFNRGNTYSKPRTITIDNKFDGVVSIDVWTGYAINVISKNGSRKVVVGPQTYLLEYDEVLEETTYVNKEGKIVPTVFLKTDYNAVPSHILVQTKDFVDVTVGVMYTVSFVAERKDSWFAIEDHLNFLTDYFASIIKQRAKKYTLEEFYNNTSEIIDECIFDEENPAVFDNGMCVANTEVNLVKIMNDEVEALIKRHQRDIVSKSLELSAANKEISVATELEKIRAEKIELEYQRAMHEIQVKSDTEKEEQRKKDEIIRMKEASEKATEEAKKELQNIKDEIYKANLNLEKLTSEQEIARKKELDKLSVDKQKAYTDAVKKVIDSISPDLVAAITTSSKADMVKEVAKSLSPYALASDNESVADVVDKLLRGTSLEGLLNIDIHKNGVNNA